MKTIKHIFDMIDLFYANKHLHDKIVKSREKNNFLIQPRVANR